MIDVVVIGAGPVGLACALELKRAGQTVLVIEKGALVNSLVGYPTNMEFFSTPDLLEIGNYPFATRNYKPRREEALDYYRRVAEQENLDLALFERVNGLSGNAGAFVVHTEHRDVACRFVVISTGFFDTPNVLDVPGCSLPKVSHYYKEPYTYVNRDIAIIGAKNSAAKAALECHRNGARVTLFIRGPEVGPTVKYWIRPDLVNRIEEGSITAWFNSRIDRIDEQSITFTGPDGSHTIPNDVVLALTGYRPDYPFLASMGIRWDADPAQTPQYDAESFETTRKGVYVAGTVCGGLHTSRWFIENGRFHAQLIAAHVRSLNPVP